MTTPFLAPTAPNDADGRLAASNEGRIDRLRNELKRSLDAMRSSAEFLVIPYSDGPLTLAGRTRWRQATERLIESAYRALRDLEPPLRQSRW